MVHIKIGDQMYAAEVRGYVTDKEWDDRESKAITTSMTYEEAKELFVDDVEWAIVYEDDETVDVYDNSEFSVSGPITDNRNGTVTVKMGKPTDAELLAVIMGG